MIQHLSIDDRAVHAARFHHQAPSATGQIVTHCAAQRPNHPVGIENRDVGCQPPPSAGLLYKIATAIRTLYDLKAYMHLATPILGSGLSLDEGPPR